MTNALSSQAHEVFKQITLVGFLTETVIERYSWQNALQELIDANLVEESTMTTPAKQMKIWVLAPAIPNNERQP